MFPRVMGCFVGSQLAIMENEIVVAEGEPASSVFFIAVGCEFVIVCTCASPNLPVLQLSPCSSKRRSYARVPVEAFLGVKFPAMI